MSKKTEQKLYLYIFPHRGLNHVYRTVQTQHAVTEMVIKGGEGLVHGKDHKTSILMEGLNSAGLKKLVEILSKTNLAWADFREDEETMEGIRTCVVFVLDKNKTYDDNVATMKLMDFMRDKKLASA